MRKTQPAMSAQSALRDTQPPALSTHGVSRWYSFLGLKALLRHPADRPLSLMNDGARNVPRPPDRYQQLRNHITLF